MTHLTQPIGTTKALTKRDALSRMLSRTSVAVPLGFLAMVFLAQVVIPLPFTPVPLSLGTLGALGAGALLGARRGAVAATAYAVAGAVGFPVLAGFTSGLTIPSFGYVIGYVFAAVMVGTYAGRAGKFHWATATAVVIAATATVYLFGVVWMNAMLHLGWSAAVAAGVTPFLVGDALKAVVVVGLLRAVKR